MIDENGVLVLSGTVTDTGTLDTHVVTITWGDGTVSVVTVDAVTRTFSAAHRYRDDNPTNTQSDLHTIGVLVTDDDTGTDATTVVVRIVNVAPKLVDVRLTSPAVGLGLLTGRVEDIGGSDTHVIIITWGDGTQSAVDVDPLTRTFSAAHLYSKVQMGFAGNRMTIDITLADDDTGIDTITSSLLVQLDPAVHRRDEVFTRPKAIASIFNSRRIEAFDWHSDYMLGSRVGVDTIITNSTGAANVRLPFYEGDRVTLSLAVAGRAIGDAVALFIDWGDGMTERFDTVSRHGVELTHVYRDDSGPGDNSIGIRIVQRDGTEHKQAVAVKILNATPRLSALSLGADTTHDGRLVLTGRISDAGVEDTHTVTITWADGTVSIGTMITGADGQSFIVYRDAAAVTASEIISVVVTDNAQPPASSRYEMTRGRDGVFAVTLTPPPSERTVTTTPVVARDQSKRDLADTSGTGGLAAPALALALGAGVLGSAAATSRSRNDRSAAKIWQMDPRLAAKLLQLDLSARKARFAAEDDAEWRWQGNLSALAASARPDLRVVEESDDWVMMGR
ncbi:hypothetical protein [Devosia psychrophila]|uniref:hypothetical protein n=1 Tax=Devosia psychrophila TaxID=728005 RepID=UPI000AE9872E|nr:hypothetical protein [Devosia psychrophila]